MCRSENGHLLDHWQCTQGTFAGSSSNGMCTNTSGCSSVQGQECPSLWRIPRILWAPLGTHGNIRGPMGSYGDLREPLVTFGDL